MNRLALKFISGVFFILILGQFVSAQALPEDLNMVNSFSEIISEVDAIPYDCDPNEYSQYIGQLDVLLRTETDQLLFNRISSYRDNLQMRKDQRISTIENDRLLAIQLEEDRKAQEEEEWLWEQEEIRRQQEIEAQYAMEEFGWVMDDFLNEIFLPVILPLGIVAITYFVVMADY